MGKKWTGQKMIQEAVYRFDRQESTREKEKVISKIVSTAKGDFQFY